ncbi:putative bifunctional diguanylate cyclase/phosphodiesterase [Nocardioides sp. GCM10027113]|uniref:putative bifunctional diguanylate cyclase/phosphodiesterase n=1 Tax=unclassified Nocardioides TaxID=2615069 RepID=UPI003606E1FB
MSRRRVVGKRPAYVTGAAAGVLLLFVSIVVGAEGGSRMSQERFDSGLTGSSGATSQALEEYFDRARAIDLLMANTPSVTQYVARGSDPAADGGHTHGHAAAELGQINSMLAYLEDLYGNTISSASLLDRHGVEIARSVSGDTALRDDLPHEAENPFFADTFATPVGRVHQALPYLSPDTDEWVISNSTVVPDGKGDPAAVMHFEVTLDSFREQLAQASSPGTEVRVIDLRTGGTVLTTDSVSIGGSLAASDAAGRMVADSDAVSGSFTEGDRRFAYRKLTRTPDNLNHWAVLVSKPYAASVWTTAPGQGALAAALAAFVLLGTLLLAMLGGQRDLRRRASTDPLTGLANRAVLLSCLEQVEVPRGRGASMLMLLDLDGFKEVNDTMGHSRGDELLCEVARRISSVVRDSDLVARLGGDEFAVLLEDVPGGPSAGETLAQRILTAIRLPFDFDGTGVRMDASLGIAVVGEHGETPEVLLQRADVAMYRAKTAGIGYAFYDADEDPHSTRRLGMTAGLLDAIEHRHFELHYQPKVDTESGDVVALEALIRWVHPTLGPLAPAEFIPIAEKTGLIRPLTEAVLDMALAQCREWHRSGHPVPVAVNISAVDLAGDALVEHIASLLATYGLPASALQLELTESAIMVDPERAQRVLERLADMGVLLAVDDYGTGYASLTYLKRLPVTELKVDRLFVSGVTHDDADRMIVSSTIELAHRLGMSVVAEGVEDGMTMSFLREHRCDSAQGFFLARPMPHTDVTAWLDGRSVDAAARPAQDPRGDAPHTARGHITPAMASPARTLRQP